MNYCKIFFVAFVLFLSGINLIAQNESPSERVVTGIVYDATTQQPIEIASVACGAIASTFTEMDGTFSISVPPKVSYITISSLGYHTKDVVISGKDTIVVFLKEIMTESFQQTASNGYFDIKQVYATQSLASVSILDDKNKIGAGSAEAAFDGRVAGLNATSRSGVKGVGSDLFLRGFSSLNINNQPLVIVDGMIYDITTHGTSLIPGGRYNPLAGIDLQDIESVSVIRDAASIYGAKAANGVVLIRTHHAVKQATTIDFNMNMSLEQAPTTVPLLGAEDYRLYAADMKLSEGLTPEQVQNLPFVSNDASLAGYYTYRNSTDWQKEVFANNVSSNYGLSIKGGDDIALYALNVSYLNQGGTVEGSDYSRFNLRFNSDINISKAVTLNSNIGFYYLQKNLTGIGVESTGDPLYQARIKAPFLQAYVQNETGITTPDLADYDLFEVSNPLALIKNMEQIDVNYRFAGSFNFNFKVTPKFNVSNLIGVVFNKGTENIFIPGYGVTQDTLLNGVIENKLKARIARHLALNNDLRGVYTNTFGYRHNVSGIAGIRLNVNNIEEDWGADYNTANDAIRDLGSGDYLLREKGGSIGDWNSLTYYLNANYDFAKKYLLSASMSLDGSSRFGAEADGIRMYNTTFGFFPAIAGSWIVSSEPFMNEVGFIDLLKLRTSYGITGNDDIGNYTAHRYYNEVNFLAYQGTQLSGIYNPTLGWEENAKLNLGVDLSFAHERLNVSVDLYRNKTTNMFDYVAADVYSGMDGYYDNVGGFTTEGFDLTVNGRIVNKPFKWDMGLVVSSFKTNVDELWDAKRVQTIYGANVLTEVGNPIGLFYGYKTDGVYATRQDAQAAGLKTTNRNNQLESFGAGDVRFVEQVVDGVIDGSDMQVIGDPTPDFTGELYTRLRYKKVSLDASMSFSYGGDVFNYMRYSLERMTGYDNQTQAVLNRWQYEGQVTDMPKLSYGDPLGNGRFSDRWIEDGSYARLRNVTLSYILPVKLGFLKRAEVYASGVNLLTITKYKGVDPEFSANSASLAQGIDIGMVPQNTAFLMGIKIGL